MQSLLEVIKLPEKNANVAHEECKSIVLQKVSSGLVTVLEHVATYIPTILLHQADCHQQKNANVTGAANQQTSYEDQKS